jgi:peptidoglycan/LPS O-acetylase OafA/YrhL
MRRAGSSSSRAGSGDGAVAQGGQLHSLTGMRFLAALLIVLHHTVANPVTGTRLVSISALRPLATVAYVGVTFFFVLSGFVLTWSWSGGPARVFFARRFARIYPLYVLTWALSFVVLWQLGRATPPTTAVLCLFLVQAWSPHATTAFGQNPVSWSLSDEAFFYAMFPLLVLGLICRPHRAIVVAIAATVACLALVPVVVYKVGSRADVRYLHYLPAYRIGEFIVGICLALLVRRGLRFPASAGLTTAVAAVWLAGVAILNEHARSIVPGAAPSGLPQVATGLIVLPMVSVWIVAAASADLDGRPSVLRSRVLRRLGIWSYALYLTHLLVLRELELALGRHVPDGLGGRIALELAAVALVIAVSGVAYHLFERPLEVTLRRRLHAQRGSRAPGDASTWPEDAQLARQVSP